MKQEIEKIINEYCAHPYAKCPQYRLDKGKDMSQAICDYIEKNYESKEGHKKIREVEPIFCGNCRQQIHYYCTCNEPEAAWIGFKPQTLMCIGCGKRVKE